MGLLLSLIKIFNPSSKKKEEELKPISDTSQSKVKKQTIEKTKHETKKSATAIGLTSKIEFSFLKHFGRTSKKSSPEDTNNLSVSQKEKMYLQELHAHFDAGKNGFLTLPKNYQTNIPNFTLNIGAKEKPIPKGIVKMFDSYNNSTQSISI